MKGMPITVQSGYFFARLLSPIGRNVTCTQFLAKQLGLIASLT